MEWSDVLNEAAAKFESLGINYIVVGSCASMIYGEIRFTQDVDILADIGPQHIAPLLAAFPSPQHYVSQVAIEQALRQRSMFNIIYSEWAIKIDVMVLDEPSRERDELGRAITIARTNGMSIRFASPEDVILNKMIYFLQGGSEKHLRDISGMLRLSRRPIDREYIARWAEKLGTQEVWQLILAKVESGL